nr:medium-chain acyl-CoA ligase ACSF2, mitochondrial-like [Lytechinus pictus]
MTLPDLKSIIMMGEEHHPGTFLFGDVMDMGGSEEHDVIDRCRKSLQFDDVANIQFTSGTTGDPKATGLTHFHIVNNMNIHCGLFPAHKPQSICVPTPLFHAFGMFVGILGVLTQCKLVYPSPGFDALACLKAMHDERCTRWYGIPTMLIDMLHHPDHMTFDLSEWEFIITGGGYVPSEVVHQLRSAFPSLKDTIIVYGMTEMGGMITCGRTNDPDDVRYSTVGRPYPWCEIKIVDPSTGEIVPIGEPGELCGRSPSNMTGYWEDDRRTKETIDPSRWLHSGDLAKMNEDGYISIVGRIKDMINRGGENIFAVHIEDHLHKHPKVEDVQVVGVPDKRLMEEVCACVKLKAGVTCTKDEIRDFCKGQLAHYEVPRHVEFVSNFPLTTSNKVQKFKLREEMAKRLKLDDIDMFQN